MATHPLQNLFTRWRTSRRSMLRAAGLGSLAAGAGLSAFDRGFLPAGDPAFGPELSYGVTASIPLFDGGDRRRRLANAEIRLRQAELASADERTAVRAAAARLAAEARGFRQLADLEAQNRAVIPARLNNALHTTVRSSESSTTRSLGGV